MAQILWQRFLVICLCKNPIAKFRTTAFSKVFSTVKLWKVDLAEKQNINWKIRHLLCTAIPETESWVKILRSSDQMATSLQFYQFFAKTSTSVHIAPIGWKWLLLVPINVSSHDLHAVSVYKNQSYKNQRWSFGKI